MKKFNTLLATLFCLCVMTAIFFSVIEGCCFDKKFYSSQYERNQTAQVIGVDDASLNQMTDVLLDYLKGKRDDISLTAEINGSNREVFNQKEKEHMIDVRNLYWDAMTVRNISAITAVVLIGILYAFNKKETFTLLHKGLFNAFIVFGALLAAIALFALIDFDTFWTTFHRLLFKNELWLMDPRTEIMINMVPSSFFSSLIYRILMYLFASYFALWLVITALKGRFK